MLKQFIPHATACIRLLTKEASLVNGRRPVKARVLKKTILEQVEIWKNFKSRLGMFGFNEQKNKIGHQ